MAEAAGDPGQGIALPSPPDNWYPAALALVPGPAVDPDALAGYLKQFSQFTVLHAAQLVGALEEGSPLKARVAEIQTVAQEAAPGKPKGKGKGKVDAPPTVPGHLFPASLAAQLLVPAMVETAAGDLRAAAERVTRALAAAREELRQRREILSDAKGAPTQPPPSHSDPRDPSRLEEDVEDGGRSDNAGAASRQEAEVEMDDAQAHADVAEVEAALAAAECDAQRPTQAARVFLVVGFGYSAERLRELRVAGVPIAGAVRLRVPGVDDATPTDTPDVVHPGRAWDSLVAMAEGDREMVLLDVPVGSECPAVFTRAAPRVRPGAGEEGEPPLGWRELAGALAVAAGATLEYRAWRGRAVIYALPDARPREHVDMQLYRTLMDTVPPGQASVPVVLHCMVEQVARSCQAEAPRANQADAVAFTTRALAGALGEARGLPRRGAEAPAWEPLIVSEGDESALAAAGAAAGVAAGVAAGMGASAAEDKRGTRAASPVGKGAAEVPAAVAGVRVGENGRVRVDIESGSEGGWRSFLLPGGALDVARVERHMALLARVPGANGLARPPPSDLGRQSLRVSQAVLAAATAEVGGVTPSQVELAQVLQRALRGAPEGVAVAHHAEVLSRRHLDVLPDAVLRQTAAEALRTLPDAASQFLPSLDAVLLTCFAGTTHRAHCATLPVLVPLAGFLAQCVRAEGAPPALPDLAYVLPPALADRAMPEAFHYPDIGAGAGAVVRVEPGHVAVAVAGGAGLCLPPAPGAPLLLTLRGGAVLAAEARMAPVGAGEPIAYNSAVRLVAPGGLVTEVRQDGSVAFYRTGGRGAGAGGGWEAPALLPADVHGGPLPGGSAAALLEAPVEDRRTVTRSGAVVRHLRGGETEALLPDGATLTRAAGEGQPWVGTNARGERWAQWGSDAAPAPADAPAAEAATGDAAPHPPTDAAATPAPRRVEPRAAVSCAAVTDPDTGAAVTTRADRVSVVCYEGGPVLVQGPDGTRVVTTPAPAPSRGSAHASRPGARVSVAAAGPEEDEGQEVRPWVAEAPGLPRVTGSAEGVRVSPVPGVEMRWHAAEGALSVEVAGVGSLAVAEHMAVLSRGTAPLVALADASADLQEGYARVMDAARAEHEEEERRRWAQYEEDKAAVEAVLAEAEGKKRRKGDEEELPSLPSPPEPRSFVAPPRADSAREVAALLPRCWVADLEAGSCALSTGEDAGVYVMPGQAGVAVFPEPGAEEAAEGDEGGSDDGEGEGEGEGETGGAAEEGKGAGKDAGADAGRVSPSEGAPSPSPGERGSRRATEGEVEGDGNVGGEGAGAEGAGDAEGEAEGAAMMVVEERRVPPLAPGVPPRVFVVRADGSGWEVLPARAFASLLAEKERAAAAGDCDIVMQTNPTPDHPAVGLTGTWAVQVDMLTRLHLRTRDVPPLPLADAPAPAAMPPPAALPTLRPPSTVTTPLLPSPPPGADAEAVLRSLFVPRVLVPRAVVRSPAPPPVLVHRQVLELPALSRDQLSRCNEALARVAAWQDQDGARDPAAQFVLPDDRGEHAGEEERAVRREAEAARKGTGLAAVGEEGHEREQEGGGNDHALYKGREEAAADAEEVAARRAERRADRRAARGAGVGAPSAGAVLRYFDSEEGLVALSGGMVVARPVRQRREEHVGQESVTVEDLEQIRRERRQSRRGRGRGRDGERPTARSGVQEGSSSLRRGGSFSSLASASERGRVPRLSRPSQGTGEAASAEPLPGAPAAQGMAAQASTDAFPGAAPGPDRPWMRSVVGGPRRAAPALPGYLTRVPAPPEVNLPHLSTEAGAFRMSRTAAGLALQSHGRFTKEFELTPDALHLGALEPGQRATATLRLANVAAEVARFTVERPPAPWQVVYRPGPLAVGIATPITVVFAAEEPGAFETDIVVRSESVVFRVPARAEVVDPATAEERGGNQRGSQRGFA